MSSSMKIGNWVDDPQAESTLKAKKIKFQVVTLPVSQIDFDASMSQRGRLMEKLDQDKTNRYGVEMLDGAKFPRPVLNAHGHKYVILSGNHRGNAAKDAGFTHLEAYVVAIDDPMLLDLLPMTFNIKHGDNVSVDERMEQAKFLIATYSLDRKQVAKDLGLRYEGLNTYLRRQGAVERLEARGVSTVNLSDVILEDLSKIANDNVFFQAGKVITQNRIRGAAATELIKEVREKKTELEALDVIARHEQQAAGTRGKADGPSRGNLRVRVKFLRAVSSLLNMLKRYKNAKSLQITNEEDIELVRSQSADLFTRFHELFSSGGRNTPDANGTGGNGHSAQGEKIATDDQCHKPKQRRVSGQSRR